MDNNVVRAETLPAVIGYYFCRRSVVSGRVTDYRCNTLLAEFLQERSSQQNSDAQERADQAEQNSEIDEIQAQSTMTLPSDLIFKIFLLLPAESLFRIQFVQKKWFGLINNSVFIRNHSQQSETVLTCRKFALSSLPFCSGKPNSYFHFFDVNRLSDNFVKSCVIDLVHVLASCDGLVLAKREKGETLMLTNPVTRKHVEIPSGTTSRIHHESYNIASCKEEKTYKVVHLFFKIPSHVGCEILSINTRTWKLLLDGPPSELLPSIMQVTISIDGSLYWMPRKRGCNYYVALNMRDEKFTTKKLPTICMENDRLIEIGGVLGLVTRVSDHVMRVWVLTKRGDSHEIWTKRCDINLNYNFGVSLFPICSSKKGRQLLFDYPSRQDLYVYDFDNGEMKSVYSREEETRLPFSESSAGPPTTSLRPEGFIAQKRRDAGSRKGKPNDIS